MTPQSSLANLPSGDLARTVIELSVDGLLVLDSEGVVLFANPAAIALFAEKTGQLVGRQLGAPAIDGPVEIVITGSEGLRHVEMRATEISWNGRPATLASLRDITEHKRARAELVEQTKALLERNAELMRFNRATVGRELRMIELKREVNALCRQLGEPPRHRIPEEEAGIVTQYS